MIADWYLLRVSLLNHMTSASLMSVTGWGPKIALLAAAIPLSKFCEKSKVWAFANCENKAYNSVALRESNDGNGHD
jgi:hypothetical protein